MSTMCLRVCLVHSHSKWKLLNSYDIPIKLSGITFPFSFVDGYDTFTGGPAASALRMSIVDINRLNVDGHIFFRSLV